MISRIIKFIFAVLSLLILIYVLLFVSVIYPNDRRISMPELSSLGQLPEKRIKISSIFTDRIDIRHEAPVEIYEKQLEIVANTYSNHVGRHSKRFVSPYQSYLAVGSYPYFLEGRDSVLLSSGKTFTVTPKIKGEVELDFGLVSLFSNADITVLHNSKVLSTYDVQAAGPVEKSDSFFYKNFTRYAFPDRPVAGGTWENHKIKLELTENDTLSFVCRSEKEGCFIDELSFWRREHSKQRNVIFILVDTLRYDALESEHAPFLKELRERSTSFDNAMGAGNMTSISTNALLSCQLPSKIGNLAFSYGLSNKDQDTYYKSGKGSFSTLLQKNGIKTAMIGNISILSDVLGIGVNHGFDDQISIEMEGYDTAHITKASIDWLKRNGSDPFFLYIHYNTTHAPYRAPLHDIFATLKGLRSFKSQREFLLSLYQAQIRHVDRNLTLLNQALKKFGLDKNTVIVLNADHGDAHELRSYFENEAGPPYIGSLFDHVGTLLYNDVLHVPLLISEPNQKSGSRKSEIVSGIDIGPTLLELFGVPKPDWCDGLSLFSEEALKKRIVVGSEGHDQRAIFYKNQYKYTKSYASSEKRITLADGYFTKNASIFIREQLFDLKNDPEEKVNLVHKDQDLFQEARKMFENYFEITETFEMIIDAPHGEKVEVVVPETEIGSLLVGSQLIEKDFKHVLEFKERKRIIIPFRKIPQTLPEIRIDGLVVALRYSSMRLPLNRISIADLPSEEVDFDRVPLSRSPTAFFVKTRGDQAMQRKLVIGNRHFENIFKEWGYLNEEK